jgi:DNA modification methylase
VSTLVVYEDRSERWGLIEADALLTLAKLPDACVDAIVCDPPYGISFQGHAWDGPDLRRGTSANPSEAFERWTNVWAREAARVLRPGGHLLAFGSPRTFHRLVCGVEDAGLEIRDRLLWMYGKGVPKSRRLPGGGGTQLKPAYEPIVLARASFTGTLAQNIELHGTGALNIDAARTESRGSSYWPANVVLSHAPGCPMGVVDGHDPGPSRLFYCDKATRAEREAGCEQLTPRAARIYSGKNHPPRLLGNWHPTVKPIGVMRWLIRLAVPEGGVVLDPFCGSGSTGAAAMLEGRRFLGIEREPGYVDIACARLAHWATEASHP